MGPSAIPSRNKLRAVVEEGSSESPAVHLGYLQKDQMRLTCVATEGLESGQNLKAKEVPIPRRVNHRCNELSTMVVVGNLSWEG